MSSARPSVTLVDCDHIGWNSSKIISLLVSVGRSFSADPTPTSGVYSKGTPEILAQSNTPPADLSVGDVPSQIAIRLQITSNPCWRQAAILDNFEWPYLRSDSFDPLMCGHLCDSTAFLLTLQQFKVIQGHRS